MSAETVNKGFNDLLKKHGIEVGTEAKTGPNDTVELGSVYNAEDQEFNVTIPVRFKPVADKVESLFREVGLRVFRGDWGQYGEEGKQLIHIVGIVQ